MTAEFDVLCGLTLSLSFRSRGLLRFKGRVFPLPGLQLEAP